jgi:hypothetical protein
MRKCLPFVSAAFVDVLRRIAQGAVFADAIDDTFSPGAIQPYIVDMSSTVSPSAYTVFSYLSGRDCGTLDP